MYAAGVTEPKPDPLEPIRRAYDDAVDELHNVRDTGDLQTAFEHASRLVEFLRQLTIEAGEKRSRMIGHIWESEKLSLAKLADKIGVSKTRADQLVRASKKERAQ